MAAHGDFSLLTINIALSDSHQGGGTWVQALGGEAGETVHAGPTGHAVIHAGGLWHAGARTTEGRRYILVLFLHSRLYIDHTAWLQTRAIAALRANDATAAVALLSLAIQLNPADAESWVQLATARRRSGDRPGALQAGRQAVALGEAAGDFSFDAVYNACCDARAEGLWAEAAAGFAEAARVAEASPEAAVPAEKQLAAELGLGACLRRLGLLEEAGEALERALGLDRDAADVWAELGLVMAQMGGGAAEAAAVVCQKNVARLMVAEKR
jgi:tetratricopeptide (TPR) repeat protein